MRNVVLSFVVLNVLLVCDVNASAGSGAAADANHNNPEKMKQLLIGMGLQLWKGKRVVTVSKGKSTKKSVLVAYKPFNNSFQPELERLGEAVKNIFNEFDFAQYERPVLFLDPSKNFMLKIMKNDAENSVNNIQSLDDSPVRITDQELLFMWDMGNHYITGRRKSLIFYAV